MAATTTVNRRLANDSHCAQSRASGCCIGARIAAKNNHLRRPPRLFKTQNDVSIAWFSGHGEKNLNRARQYPGIRAAEQVRPEMVLLRKRQRQQRRWQVFNYASCMWFDRLDLTVAARKMARRHLCFLVVAG